MLAAGDTGQPGALGTTAAVFVMAVMIVVVAVAAAGGAMAFKGRGSSMLKLFKQSTRVSGSRDTLPALGPLRS